jgi:hypothetical protein
MIAAHAAGACVKVRGVGDALVIAGGHRSGMGGTSNTLAAEKVAVFGLFWFVFREN